jgi:hypothetical protein
MLADAEEPATPAYDIDGSDLTHGDPHTVRSKDPRAVATDPRTPRAALGSILLSQTECDMAEQPLLLFAKELRTRAKEILVRMCLRLET